MLLEEKVENSPMMTKSTDVKIDKTIIYSYSRSICTVSVKIWLKYLVDYFKGINFFMLFPYRVFRLFFLTCELSLTGSYHLEQKVKELELVTRIESTKLTT